MGDFDAEIDSIRAAASWMESNAIATAQNLKDTLTYLNGYAAQSDWSTVPSCIAFGASYNSAIDTYTKVAEDMLADAQKMKAALTKIADDYENADASSRAAFDAAIAKFSAAGYMTETPATAAYKQHRSDLHSDDPHQAQHQDADTNTSGSAPVPTPAAATTGGGQVRME